MTDARGGTTDRQTTRRGVLKAAGAASAAGAAATLFSTGAVADPADPRTTSTEPNGVETDRGVFPQSVASGGPTPRGAIVWTRLDRELARFTDLPLYLQVATAAAVAGPNEDPGDVPNAAADFGGATTYEVSTGTLVEEHDYTVSVDLAGELDPDTFYFYRFVYDGAASPVGRLHTLPAPDASVDDLTLAVSSCNNYQHGYWGAFSHIAAEDADYHVSLGDFLYEYAGAGNQPGRDIALPSGNGVIHTLADYRHQHRVYRSDEHMQRVLERHTLIHTWDDHEIINNRWWNDDQDAPQTTSHPSYSGDPEAMRRLYARGIKAMLEYLPLRVEYTDPLPEASQDAGGDTDAQEYFRLYRSFKFGDLAELFMTDERLYRSPPPEDEAGQRDTATPPAPSQSDLDRSMLGGEQYEWFLDGGSNPGAIPDTEGVTGTDAQWKLHGNEVLSAALKTVNAGPGSLYLNYDAWDGYEAERNLIMARLARDNVDNFVTRTGDMHSYVAGYLKQDYKDPQQSEYVGGPRVGVEFMTPGVSSDNLGSAGGLPPEMTEDAIDEAIRTQNPHIEWFNSSRWGYTVINITSSGLTYTAYGVDRSVDSADPPKQLLRSYRVPAGSYELQEFRSPPLSGTIGDLAAASYAGTAPASDGPDVETAEAAVTDVTESVTGEPDGAGSTATTGSDGAGATNANDSADSGDDGGGVFDPITDAAEDTDLL